ncbi:membrane protein [Micromonospora sp. M42]|nr:membrane protein [Micromonospora sp. M42]
MIMRLSHAPLRVAIGAYILNSGLGKRGLEGEAAAGMHGMAAGAMPQLRQIPPDRFAVLLSRGETVLGAALLAPFVPSLLAGAALTAFGAGLVQLYLKTPGMREGSSLRPSQEGIGLAKDVWLVGAGLTLMLDSLVRHRR